MIELKDLDFAYSKRKKVLQNVDLTLQKGLIYGLLGKNGEGKTTLIKILSGMLFPDHGTCKVLNETPSKRSANFLQQMFVLPEEILLPEVKASDYLKMYAPFYPSYNKEIEKKCLESFEIDTTQNIQKMSLGQKKKVALTMALSAHTPLLFMDEPTNGLDVPSKVMLRKLLALFTTEEQTIIISTHQIRELETLLDAIIIIDDKEILFNKTIEEISTKLQFRKLEIGEEAFYSETFPNGTFGIVRNETGEKTSVSLELFLNMAFTQKEKTKSLLNE